MYTGTEDMKVDSRAIYPNFEIDVQFVLILNLTCDLFQLWMNLSHVPFLDFWYRWGDEENNAISTMTVTVTLAVAVAVAFKFLVVY